jgi:3-isopropylmalate/(R)-2-methylmalate dehydratase small subunit
MNQWKKHAGNAIVITRDDIDTDQLLPKQFMKLIDKKGYGKYLFYNWRYLDQEGKKLNPDFVLNQNQDLNPTILVAGKNFGCGSSREHAAWALSDYGMKVIIAESFGDIFTINASKNGIALIKLVSKQIDSICNWVHSNRGTAMSIDLERQLIQFGDTQMKFHLEDSFKNRIIFGLDDIDLTLKEIKSIDSFIKSYHTKNHYLNLV